MSLEDIRGALDVALTAMGVRPIQEIDQAPNVTGEAPAAMVEFGGANYLAVFGGAGNDLTFTVVFIAGRASERAARKKLDGLVDPTPGAAGTVVAGLNGNLGGTVASCTVAAASEYRNYPTGAGDYLGSQVTVVIQT